MNTLVIEHVAIDDLPAAWRAKMQGSVSQSVTVRIEEEPEQQNELTENPMFGMWQDRTEMADVAGYVAKLRAPRFDLAEQNQ